jgi:threonine/homoserine/homoserine lactone efflux protein
MEVFFAVLSFAFSSTITPGPNNLMMLASGVNYGVKASLPHLIGICLGFPLMVLLVGLGFGAVFSQFPALHSIIKWLGIVYLLYLAWKIASSAPRALEGGNGQPFSFWQAAAFQWVNVKAWMMATGAIAAFTTVGGAVFWDVTQIVLAFFVMSFPCVGAWLVFGAMLQNLLQTARAQRVFNIVMGLILASSVVPMLVEEFQQFA